MSEQPIKVLLLEDSQTQAEIFLQWLSNPAGQPGFQVEWVDTLAKALECIKQERMDVILSDLSVSDSNGLDTCRHLLAHASSIPVVVLTQAFEDEKLALEAVKAGAQDYLLKTEADEKLVRRVLLYAIERKLITDALFTTNRELERKLENIQWLNNVMMGLEARIADLQEENRKLRAGVERPSTNST